MWRTCESSLVPARPSSRDPASSVPSKATWTTRAIGCDGGCSGMGLPEVLRKDPGYPKVQWNAFGATGKGPGSWNPAERGFYPLIDDIAPLGFEEVMIDVGWWQGSEPDFDVADWPAGMRKAAGLRPRAQHAVRAVLDGSTRHGESHNPAATLPSHSPVVRAIPRGPMALRLHARSGDRVLLCRGARFLRDGRCACRGHRWIPMGELQRRRAASRTTAP